MSVHAFLCGIRGLLGPLASLSLYEVYGAQFVGHLSAAGFALSIVLMAPLIPVLRRRQAEVEGGRAAQAVDQEAELRAAEPPGAE
jgi:hypothetical protein